MWRLMIIVSTQENSPVQSKSGRIIADKAILVFIYGTPILWAGLLVLTLLPITQNLLDRYIATWLVSIGLAFLVSLDIAIIRFKTYRLWKGLKETVATKAQRLFTKRIAKTNITLYPLSITLENSFVSRGNQ